MKTAAYFLETGVPMTVRRRPGRANNLNECPTMSVEHVNIGKTHGRVRFEPKTGSVGSKDLHYYCCHPATHSSHNGSSWTWWLHSFTTRTSFSGRNKYTSFQFYHIRLMSSLTQARSNWKIFLLLTSVEMSWPAPCRGCLDTPSGFQKYLKR